MIDSNYTKTEYYEIYNHAMVDWTPLMCTNVSQSQDKLLKVKNANRIPENQAFELKQGLTFAVEIE